MAQTQTVDPKAFYGYLFAHKQPTKVLDALLRGVAQYIVSLARQYKLVQVAYIFLYCSAITSVTEMIRASPPRRWLASTRLLEETTIVGAHFFLCIVYMRPIIQV